MFLTLLLFIGVPELPAPKLRVFPAATGKREMLLSCEVSQSSPVSQCIFYFMGDQKITRPSSSCQFSLTQEQMAGLASQERPSLHEFRCYYTVAISGVSVPSDHSSNVSKGKWLWIFWNFSAMMAPNGSYLYV